jgi:hypothetical protein
VSATTWHATDDVLTAFARAPRTLDHTTAASVETHVAACERCRGVVAGAADASLARSSWDAITDVIDRPRRSLVERVLATFLPPHMARLLAATPTLQAAWLAAVVVVAGAAVAATHNLESDGLFLVLAPLVPLAGVALTFAPAADPAGEAALATPAHGAALVVARTLAVVATSLPVLLVGSLLLPQVDARAVAWLLPALALTAAVTALSTWLTPQAAVAAAAMAWTGAVAAVARFDGTAWTITRSDLFGSYGQLLFAALFVAAVVVATARRDHFTTLEAR